MIKLLNGGVYLLDGVTLIPDMPTGIDRLGQSTPSETDPAAARKSTLAYRILAAHNTSGDMAKLKIKFDQLTSHDITYVGIIQTARASGLREFPLPYVLTNCHNSLAAVGGTINEDDHMFGLSCARKYGGVYVPPHQAVIHQYAREMMAGGGRMILGSDSHTRHGALGTLAMGEGGPELVKQLLGQTYDIDMPEVILCYLSGAPSYGVGPQDVALAIIGAVFDNGHVKNKIIEFAGPGLANLSADFRIGIDVMTTETTCLSSIWATDDVIKEYYEIHGRADAYRELRPAAQAYYDGAICVELNKIEPMIAMPFHPSHVYTIAAVRENPADILAEVEQRAAASLDGKLPFSLRDKIRDGVLHVDQGIIAGCAGGGFENICAAADILNGRSTGNDEFSLSVYPASTPIYMELIKNGQAARLLSSGAILKTAFCGPCFGAGDTPAHNAFSIRHTTRNFPSREGSKPGNGQLASVALMDARSIAATAANGGRLTSAADFDVPLGKYKYYFDESIYKNRVFDALGKPDPTAELHFGPGIRDWPEMIPLSENILLKVVSVIHDPVTTTDELIPSGETSSYRSNPHALAEYTLSRKDPAYVGMAKAVREAEAWRLRHYEESKVSSTEDCGSIFRFAEEAAMPDSQPSPPPSFTEAKATLAAIAKHFPAVAFGHDATLANTAIASTIFAVCPGDGSAREQAASCQRVLGGLANISQAYATKRYRSNLINWGMLPFLLEPGELPFDYGSYIFIPGIREALSKKQAIIRACVLGDADPIEFELRLGDLTDEERDIILSGCLINFNR